MSLSPIAALAREAPDLPSPSFTTVPELSAGFDLLYQQKFYEARDSFADWRIPAIPTAIGEVAVAASYLLRSCPAKAC